MTTGGIYAIVNSVNGKVYVGSAYNFAKRRGEHFAALRNRKHSSRKLQNAWNKYGDTAFTFTVLEVVADPIFLLAREQFWLWRERTFENGYNCKPTAAGSLGLKHSDETKAKLSVLKTGVAKSSEACAKMSEYQRNRTLEHHAKIVAALRSPEMIARRLAAHVGAKRSDETKAKISAAAKKRGPQSAETRAKKSEAGKRRSRELIERIANGLRGRKHTPEARAKISAGRIALFAARRAAAATV